MFQNLVDIIAAPSAAFARLKEKPTVLFPLLLVLFATASVQVGYILLTDRGFLVEQQLDQAEAMGFSMSDEQREEAVANMLETSTTTMVLNTGISTMLISFVIMALYALYLRFVSKFSFVELPWKAWLSLLSWSSIPLLFGAIASWVVLLKNPNGQLPILELNVLNFSNLLGLNATGGPLLYLSLLHLWSFALLAFGYQHWTKKGLVASTLLALGPYILIFGLWGIL